MARVDTGQSARTGKEAESRGVGRLESRAERPIGGEDLHSHTDPRNPQ